MQSEASLWSNPPVSPLRKGGKILFTFVKGGTENAHALHTAGSFRVMNRFFIAGQPCTAIAAIILFLCIAACDRKPSANKTAPPPTDAPSWFTDITAESGITFTHFAGETGQYFYPEIMGSGCALFDYDNDGDLDAYFINGCPHHDGLLAPDAAVTNQLFRREPDGTYTNVTANSGLNDTGFGMGVAVGDTDNDGDLDVYVTNVGLNIFYRNNGDGTFTDDTTAAGFDDSAVQQWSASAAFFDFDRDGDLDLYVTNYLNYDAKKSCRDKAGAPDYCGPLAFEGASDRLYRNDGDGTFTDITDESGIGVARGRGLGVVCADFNDDGRPDVFVANDGEANLLWIKRDDGTFADHAVSMGVAFNMMGRSEASMGIALGDVDNDHRLDLLCTHLHSESNTLYLGQGSAGFEDATGASGLGAASMDTTGFGAGFLDADHDGDLDLFLVNGRVKRGTPRIADHLSRFWQAYAEPDLFFINEGDAHFHNATSQAAEMCDKPFVGRGLAIGDIDRDGDIDILVSNDAGPAKLFRNDTPRKGRWLVVEPIVAPGRTPAIGAVVTVTFGKQSLRRDIRSASSYLSANDPAAHFGLGDHGKVDTIRIVWPDGATESFVGVAADQYVQPIKGQGSQAK